jgi:predicted lipid carrier protein YhbT
MQQDYYSALASIIMASPQNNAQLRRTVYELARSKLRQQLHRNAKELSPSERAQQLLALETAITQIETDLSENIPLPTNSRANVVATVPDSRVEIIPPARHPPPLPETGYESTAHHTPPPRSTKILRAVTLVAAVILGGVTYLVIERGLHEEPQSKLAVSQNTSRNSDRSSSYAAVPNIPTPSAYGVYALADGRLTELQPLPIRAPDQRVAISGIVSSPSSTKLPNGRAQFVVFRRDLVNNAPEKVVVRVVAQVMRASAFEHNEEISNRGRSWAVRSISYQMKVAPVDGNPAMIVIRPAEVDFSFPPGRYALVLKTVAYDFSIDGPITDLVQCVQRSDESDAAIFTECPKR